MKIGSLEILTRKTCLATLATIYGVGPTKAKRIASVLLLNPKAQSKSLNFEALMKTSAGYSVFHNMPVAKKLRLRLAGGFASKFKTLNYRALRMVLGYPAHGQRTHANSKTTRRFNPYNHLRVEPDNYKVAHSKYKLKELFDNERFDEHKALSHTLQENTKRTTSQKKSNVKQSRENIYRKTTVKKK